MRRLSAGAMRRVLPFGVIALAISCAAALTWRRAEVPPGDFVLELPWRAAVGEWAGRDFQHARGPLWQAATWLGRPPPRTGAEGEIRRIAAFLLVSLAIGLVTALRSAAKAWTRVVLFGALALGAGAVDALDGLACVALIVAFAAPARATPPRAATDGQAIVWAVGVIGLALLAVDRAILAAAAIGPAAVAESLVTGSTRRAAHRVAIHLTALVEGGVLFAILAGPLLGVDVMVSLAASVSRVLAAAEPVELASTAIGVGLCIAFALSTGRSDRRAGERDPFAAMTLCGAALLPLGPRLAGELGGTPPLASIAFVLAIVAVRPLDRGPISGASAAIAAAASAIAIGLVVSGAILDVPRAGSRGQGERCAVDVAEVLSSWPKASRPALAGDAVRLEAGTTRSRGDMILPITPCAGSCFDAETRFAQGTVVEVDTVDARSRTRLLSSPVPSGLLRVPLERWAGRRVLLSVGSSPSIQAAAREKVRLDRPRIEPCSCQPFVRLSDALRSKQARLIHSTPEARNRSIFLHPNPPGEARAEIAFPVTPCSGACFASGFHLGEAPGVGDGVAFTVDVLSAQGEIALSYESFGPGDSPRRIEASLEAWAGRAVSIRIGVEPGLTPNWDWSSFVDPVIGRCQAGGGASSE